MEMSNINKQENFGEFAIIILAGVAIYMVIGPDGVLKTNKNEVPATNTSENSIVNNNTNNNTTTNTNEIENQNTTTGE